MSHSHTKFWFPRGCIDWSHKMQRSQFGKCPKFNRLFFETGINLLKGANMPRRTFLFQSLDPHLPQVVAPLCLPPLVQPQDGDNPRWVTGCLRVNWPIPNCQNWIYAAARKIKKANHDHTFEKWFWLQSDKSSSFFLSSMAWGFENLE